MEPRHLIRAAIAASVVGHLALAVGVYFADARPMEPHEEAVTVDLVTPQELAEAEKKAEEKLPEPEQKKPEPEKPEFRLPDLTTRPTLEEQKTQAAAKPSAPASQQEQPAQPKPEQKQATSAQPPAPQAPPSPSSQQQAQPSAPPQQAPQSAQPSAAEPPLQQPAASQPPQPPPTQQVPPAPDPDLTVKYGVMLGLPGFGGGGTPEQADISTVDIAAFHRHLKSCLKMPAGVARSDDSMVKLRATLAPDGRLTAEPTVLEVRRPAKAALLLQAARQALEACQPYTMLPADKYNEWKVLDLPFTPQDFAG